MPLRIRHLLCCVALHCSHALLTVLDGLGRASSVFKRVLESTPQLKYKHNERHEQYHFLQLMKNIDSKPKTIQNKSTHI